MRRSLLIASAVACAAVTLTGCSLRTTVTTDGGASSEALPACDGSATSAYGLGEAVRSSIAQLSTVRPRFSTGLGEVTDNAGRLTVSLRLCGPGATENQTKDAASAVARSVAASSTLGAAVDEVRIENPDAALVIISRPFDSARFANHTKAQDLRGLWTISTGR